MTPQFKRAVETYGPRFMADLGLTALQTAGIFGNLAVESGQFRHLQELNPTVKGSRGGWGWPQWTGPRRRQFEAWAKVQGLKLDDPEGFYRYMLLELEGSEKAALTALRRTTTLDGATSTFMLKYERPGVPHLDKRKDYALEALHVLEAKTTPAPPKRPVSDRMAIPDGKWAEEVLPTFEVSAIQTRLVALGYQIVGVPDGIWGDRTTAAVKALQTQAARRDPSIVADGHYGPQTKALLADDANRASVSTTRASTTESDLAKIGTPGVIQGRKIQWASVLGILSAIVGAAFSAWQATQAGTVDMPFGASIALSFAPGWLAAIAPFVFSFATALYAALKGRGLVETSVERFREGIDNTGLPPESERRPGGLFGRIFGAQT